MYNIFNDVESEAVSFDDNLLDYETFIVEHPHGKITTVMKKKYHHLLRYFIKHHNRFLDLIKEKRTDYSSYKKYLLIRMSPDEIFDSYYNISNTLIRKNVPEWVLEDIRNGKTVEAIIEVKNETIRSGVNFYIKNNDKIIKTHTRNKGRVWEAYRDRDKTYPIINRVICGKINLTKIIKSQITTNGEYDTNILSISRETSKNIEVLEKFGKMKPIYLIGFSDIELFDKDVNHYSFMTKFSVKKDIDEESYILTVDKLYKIFNNMGTVWA